MSTETVYLLHFDEPVTGHSHYLGWTRRFEGRMNDHRTGSGSKATNAARAQGIGFQVAVTWEGTQKMESYLIHHGYDQYCPICHPEGAEQVPDEAYRGHLEYWYQGRARERALERNGGRRPRPQPRTKPYPPRMVRAIPPYWRPPASSDRWRP